MLITGNHDSGEEGKSVGDINEYVKHCPFPFGSYFEGKYGKQ